MKKELTNKKKLNIMKTEVGMITTFGVIYEIF